jgi:hypothetical protein
MFPFSTTSFPLGVIGNGLTHMGNANQQKHNFDLWVDSSCTMDEARGSGVGERKGALVGIIMKKTQSMAHKPFLIVYVIHGHRTLKAPHPV